MWVIKCKGETFYVNHVDVHEGVGFSTKETPNNATTKGSIKLRGKLQLQQNENGETLAIVYP